jgi:hypothetical protein
MGLRHAVSVQERGSTAVQTPRPPCVIGSSSTRPTPHSPILEMAAMAPPPMGAASPNTAPVSMPDRADGPRTQWPDRLSQRVKGAVAGRALR